MLGGVAGGGPVGVGLGAAAASPLAMQLQALLAENIEDPIIRNEVLVALTPEAVIGESVSNGLLFGTGAHFTEILADFLGPLLTKLGVGRMLAQGLHYLFRLLI